MPASDESDDGNDGLPTAAWVVAGVGTVVAGLLVVSVLAAVAGSFVLGLGPPGQTASSSPTAGFELRPSDGSVEITMEGGDAMNASRVELYGGGDRLGSWAGLATDGDGEVEAGDRVVLERPDPGTEIRVVWRGEETAATLFADELPATETSTTVRNGRATGSVATSADA